MTLEHKLSIPHSLPEVTNGISATATKRLKQDSTFEKKIHTNGFATNGEAIEH